jgi:hypothetical protein
MTRPVAYSGEVLPSAGYNAQVDNSRVALPDTNFSIHSRRAFSFVVFLWPSVHDHGSLVINRSVSARPIHLFDPKPQTRIINSKSPLRGNGDAHCESGWGHGFAGNPTQLGKLRPRMYRYTPLKRHVGSLEDEIRQEFDVRASSLGPERPSNSWEWYFLMQHSGVPTRDRWIGPRLP